MGRVSASLFRALTFVALTGATLTGAALAWAAPAGAQHLRVAYVEFPPFTHTEGSTPAGSLFEQLDKVAADAGFTYTAQAIPPRRLFQALPDGEFDLFMGVKSPPSFEGTTVASAEPIATINLHAWGLGDVPEITKKEDLSGLKVIVLSGYSYGGWRVWMDDPANKVELVEARTAEQAVQLLTGGRAPLLLQYTLPMEQALGGKAPDGLTSKPISSVDLFYVVSKKTLDAEGVLSRLEASTAKVRKSGG